MDFQSQNTSIATVDSNGLVTCQAGGQTGVVATIDPFIQREFCDTLCTVTGTQTIGPATCPVWVDPSVTIEPFIGVPKNGTLNVQVTLNPPISSHPVTLQLVKTSGTGSARFDSNNSNTISISGSQTVAIEGVTESSTADNIELRVKGNSGSTLATEKFSVVWVTLALRTSGGVSSDNSARSNYSTVIGGTSLGTFMSSGTSAQIWRNAVEIVGTVMPSNFVGNIVIQREVTKFNEFRNSNTVFATGGPFADTSTNTHRDDDPQSGNSNGKVYDLDAPGHNVPGTTVGDFRRFRTNFRQWATFNGLTVSADFNWFSRLSVIESANGEVLKTDVSGDNQAGSGATNLTWNLQ